MTQCRLFTVCCAFILILNVCYCQCCDLETLVLRLESTRVHFTEVSVSRPWCQGLGLEILVSRSWSWSRELNGKVSFTAGCSRFYINLVKMIISLRCTNCRKKSFACLQRLLLLRGVLATWAFICTLTMLGWDQKFCVTCCMQSATST